jgi:hypothetical protein
MQLQRQGGGGGLDGGSGGRDRLVLPHSIGVLGS